MSCSSRCCLLPKCNKHVFFLLLKIIQISYFLVEIEAVARHCDDPGAILNGRRVFLHRGKLVQYVCEGNYEVYGNPLLSCTRGQWIGKKPICIAPGCPSSINPTGIIRRSEKGGALLRHQCEEGFEMKGNAVIYCDGKQWSGTPPICERTTPEIPQIAHPDPPVNAIPDPVHTPDTELPQNSPEEEENKNHVRKPIYLGSSEKRPVFHSLAISPEVQRSGVLPLYKTNSESEGASEAGNEQHSAAAQLNPVQQSAQNPKFPLQQSRRPSQPLPTLQNRYYNRNLPWPHNYGRVYRPVPRYGTIIGYPYDNMPMMPIGPIVTRDGNKIRNMGLPPYYYNPYYFYGRRYLITNTNSNSKQTDTSHGGYNNRNRISSGSLLPPTYTDSRDVYKSKHKSVTGKSNNPVYNGIRVSTSTNPKSHFNMTTRQVNQDGNVGIRSVPFLIQPLVPPKSTQSAKDMPGKLIDTNQQGFPSVIIKGIANITDLKTEDEMPESSQYIISIKPEPRTKLNVTRVDCPPPPKPRRGYHIIRPLPADYKDDNYLYYIEYRCISGLVLVGGDNTSYCLRSGSWSGKVPTCQEAKCTRGHRLTASGLCEDVDECQHNNGECLHKCRNYFGGYYCECNFGYKIHEDKKQCIDIDECAASSERRCQQECVNTLGSFRCSCLEGYVLLEHDNRTCLDINECLTTNRCEQYCENTFGSYRCLCKEGYILAPNGYGCSKCPEGYLMEIYVENNNMQCVDENECMENGGRGKCEQICMNTEGSFVCSCSQGYTINEDRLSCQDIDECQSNDACPNVCTNTEGSFYCSCPVSMVIDEDGVSCKGCPRNTFSSNGLGCTPCPQNSITDDNVNATSLSDCFCLAGYRGSPELSIPCTDIDECEDDNYGCSHGCVNTPGSVHCECPEGYTLQFDGRNCRDLDECIALHSVCGRGSKCRNTEGGYNCTCTHGYEPDPGNSNRCVDVNECLTNNGGCRVRCHNYEGGYRCSCYAQSRIDQDGKSCIPIRGNCSPLLNLNKGRVLPTIPCLGQNPVSVGRVCLYACHSGYKLIGPSRRRCEAGGWTGTTPTCVAAELCPPLVVSSDVQVTPLSCAISASRPWHLCVFNCKNPSHSMEGSKSTRCGMNREWESKPPRCVTKLQAALTIPRIQCPPDIDVDLAPGRSDANVTILQPVTNMFITEQRNDGSASRNTFPAGTTRVRFTAFTNDRMRQASCEMRVRVRDKEAPVIQRCPGSISIESSEEFPEISWEAPLFSDNVRVTDVKESRDPTGPISWGSYSVTYTASDAAGNMAECAFTVSIRRPLTQKQDLACGRPRGPRNGKANCQKWARGVYCIPRCYPGYAFERRLPHYVCDDSGFWTPSSIIPDCIDVRAFRAKGTRLQVITTSPPTQTSSTVKITTTTNVTTKDVVRLTGKPEISTNFQNQFSEVSTPPTRAPNERLSDVGSNTLPGGMAIISKADKTPGNQTSSSTSSEHIEITAARPTAPKLKILPKPRFYLVPNVNSPQTPTIIRKANEGLSAQSIVRRLPPIRKISPDPITNCPTGRAPQVNSVGETICVECPRGTYRPNREGIKTCRLCSPGYYQDQTGMGHCNKCPNYIVYRDAHRSQIGGLFLGLRSAEECHKMKAIARRNERVAAEARHGNLLRSMHSTKARSKKKRSFADRAKR